jgi:hypothetical protein
MNAALPEDASWAVPQSIRQQVVAVTSNSDKTIGFQTKSLRILVEPRTFALSITDL